jgi:hypothetical protein
MRSSLLGDGAECKSKAAISFLDGKTMDIPTARVKLEGPRGVLHHDVGILDTLPEGIDVLIGRDAFEILNEKVDAKTVSDSDPIVPPSEVSVVTRAQEQINQRESMRVHRDVSNEKPSVKPLIDTKSGDEIVVKDNIETEVSAIDSHTARPITVRDEKLDSSSSSNDRQPNTTVECNGTGEMSTKVQTSALGTDSGKTAECVAGDTVFSLDKADLLVLQRTDNDLKRIRELAKQAHLTDTGYFRRHGLLMRRSRSGEGSEAKYSDQLIVPTQCRRQLLELAHDIPMAGHMGVDKTRKRLLAHYFWPGIYNDVEEYCKSCPRCQKVAGKKYVSKAELIPIPVVSKVFSKLSIDLVGPLEITESRNRYILTVVDYATRYPIAYPLKVITAEAVAECLLDLFTDKGIPDEIVSDQGTQFMSSLIQQLCQTLGIKSIRSSVYHPATNGLVERFNGTMKSMLRKFVYDNPKHWDKYLKFLMFAYREVPEASTGFSPFELVYGWPIKGPLDIVAEKWTSEEERNDDNVISYVLEMRQKLAEALELAHEELANSQVTMKTWYDAKARTRELEVGDEVLVLLPMTAKCLEAEWQGPYPITRKIGKVDYEVNVGKSRKQLRVYHVNMLKKWRARVEECMFVHTEADEMVECVVEETEGWEYVEVSSELPVEHQQRLNNLLRKYGAVFSDKPSITNAAIFSIETGDAKPIAQRPYRIPQIYRREFDIELEGMLSQGIIEESVSEWCSPVVIVPKMKDGKRVGIRPCIDFRRINEVTRSDPYPLPRTEELIEAVGNSRYISKFDLAKGYYQIPLDPKTRDRSAFVTTRGIYQFRVMPFGTKAASACFQRMIQGLLKGTADFAGSFIDDIVIYSNSFDDHLQHVEEILKRLQDANLTVKPSKSQVGYAQVPYLGHMVGKGQIRPLEAKVETIRQFPRPETKRQVRGFLGIAGYYSRYIPSFANLVAPITDLTRKTEPRKVNWTQECESAFVKVKQALCSRPVLTLPDYDKGFIVQVDASERGLGAILCQKDQNDIECPVAYASRKLVQREQHLSTTEKECLGLVWAVDYFKPYITGRKFLIQVDHNPLVWLQRTKDSNQKLLRWSLKLQEYDFDIEYKKGSSHTNVDTLSRIA